jgi:hypothetical protein
MQKHNSGLAPTRGALAAGLLAGVSTLVLMPYSAVAGSACISQADVAKLNAFSNKPLTLLPSGAFKLGQNTVSDGTKALSAADLATASKANLEAIGGVGMAMDVSGAASASSVSSTGGNAGPPSISSIDTSNNQAAELIRQRRDLAQAAAAAAPQPVLANAPAPQPAAAPQPVQVAARPQPAQPARPAAAAPAARPAVAQAPAAPSAPPQRVAQVAPATSAPAAAVPNAVAVPPAARPTGGSGAGSASAPAVTQGPSVPSAAPAAATKLPVTAQPTGAPVAGASPPVVPGAATPPGSAAAPAATAPSVATVPGQPAIAGAKPAVPGVPAVAGQPGAPAVPVPVPGQVAGKAAPGTAAPQVAVPGQPVAPGQPAAAPPVAGGVPAAPGVAQGPVVPGQPIPGLAVPGKAVAGQPGVVPPVAGAQPVAPGAQPPSAQAPGAQTPPGGRTPPFAVAQGPAADKAADKAPEKGQSADGKSLQSVPAPWVSAKAPTESDQVKVAKAPEPRFAEDEPEGRGKAAAAARKSAPRDGGAGDDRSDNKRSGHAPKHAAAGDAVAERGAEPSPARVVVRKRAHRQPDAYTPAPVRAASVDYGRIEQVAPTVQPMSYGAWGQIYGDKERHTNLAPGSVDNPTRNQTTFGQIAGIDVTNSWMSAHGRETVQLGVLAGHNDTRSKFTDTPNVTDASQRDEGVFVGTYASYQMNRFSLDALAKVDFYNLSRRSTSLKTDTTTVSCGSGQVLIVDDPADLSSTVQSRLTSAGDVRETNFTLGMNAAYRFDLHDGYWFEPTAGFRYTYTGYGSGASSLNLDDGQVLRLQAGARIGTSWNSHGFKWSPSLLGLLYSDVLVRGFTLNDSGFASGASSVDEGKLRALGQLVLKLEDGTGMSYTAQADVRGGQDVFGYGGRLGIRYEW